MTGGRFLANNLTPKEDQNVRPVGSYDNEPENSSRPATRTDKAVTIYRN